MSLENTFGFASQFAAFIDNMRQHHNSIYIGTCLDLVRLCHKYSTWSVHYANTGNSIKANSYSDKIINWCDTFGFIADFSAGSGTVRIKKNNVDIGFVPIP